MARISRMCYESSFYHVMVQGINRERIYEKSFMKDYFIDTLCQKSQDIKEVINKYLMKHRKKLCELDNSEIKELSKIILNTCSITKKELVEVLQIERTKWYRIMGGSY